VKIARPVQVNRVARKLAARTEKKKSKDPRAWGSKPLCRKEFTLRRRLLIAYDLETSRIAPGETPQPKYLTAFTEGWSCSTRVDSMEHLLTLLRTRFLIPEYNRCRFVAWNGNHFDVYLVARALLGCDDFILRPYLTRSKSLRGLKVIARQKTVIKGRNRIASWEFLDGISMTGLVGVPLKTRKPMNDGEEEPKRSFFASFAPEFDGKGGPDFEREEFDSTKPDHVAYAERDSEGLYVGILRYENIVAENFGMALQPTVGNLGIKIFQMKMPQGVTCWKPSYQALLVIRNQALRGGFCYRARRHDGPLWKYDLNQAYAAAMRDTALPAGRCVWSPKGGLHPYARVFIVRVRGHHPGNKVPFYCRNMEGKSVFATSEIPETWITSQEYAQLRAEGARLEVIENYFWDDEFRMTEFVNELERVRATAGDSQSALGIVVKQLGTNSYGKTVERLDGLELVMTPDCPQGYSQYQAENDELQCVWYRFTEPVMREYHQPQLGAFITAHVRMVLRRAILQAPGAWLYADTDCLAFDRPVRLPLDPRQYGKWKIEESGTEYYVIEKKVYASKDGKTKHAKGMNVKRLDLAAFERWYRGEPPVQEQTQRVNFVKFAAGADMFASRKKVGQRV
jgi:hypothetical protein